MKKGIIVMIGTCVAALAFVSMPRSAATNEPQPGTRCTRFADKAPTKADPGPGSRCTRFSSKHKRSKFFANQPPTVQLTASAAIDGQSAVTAAASDPDGDSLFYTYSVTGGRISGEGAKASWDLSSVAAGTYTLAVEVDDGCGCIAFNTTNVTVH